VEALHAITLVTHLVEMVLATNRLEA
jgi:hypothetical protein